MESPFIGSTKRCHRSDEQGNCYFLDNGYYFLDKVNSIDALFSATQFRKPVSITAGMSFFGQTKQAQTQSIDVLTLLLQDARSRSAPQPAHQPDTR
jgi:hypothetical protein